MSAIIVSQIAQSYKTMKMSIKHVVISLALAGFLTGCGLKGPLYLPKTESAQPAPVSPAPAGSGATTGQHQTQP
jgi:predicted small lipoprotein YifL